MKKRTLLLIALLFLALPLMVCADGGEDIYQGTVRPAEEYVFKSPYDGVLSFFPWQAGMRGSKGDTAAEFETTEYISPIDGKVVYVFFTVGDQVEQLNSRGVISIEPEVRCTVQADLSYAYKAEETRFLQIGDIVTIRSTSMKRYMAEGMVTSMEGTYYTVSVTNGSVIPEDTVNIYLSSKCQENELAGIGLVKRTPLTMVSGTGYIKEIYIKQGDAVKKGDSLFTTSPVADMVTLPENAIILDVSVKAGDSVMRKQPLFTWCPTKEMDIAVYVTEDQLIDFTVDKEVFIRIKSADYFGQGKVRFVSSLKGSDYQHPNEYEVLIRFASSVDIRLGMSAEVYLENILQENTKIATSPAGE